MRLRAGDFVDDMEIVGMLGEGATSEVYLVKDRAGIFRALKLLSVHGSAHRRRMRIEAGALRHIRHENVVGVLAMVEHESWMGVLMEYVAGPTLHRWMDIDATPADEAVRLARGILTGVDVLHQAGLVHRDMKPGNVLLDVSRDGVRPRLADFGLVKQLWDGEGATHTGVSMGTPTYMAPEQLRDASRVDGRADLFAIGCILYELLAGRPPFNRSDMYATWKAIEAGDRADLSALPADLPGNVTVLVQGLLEPDPNDRIPDVDSAFELLDIRRPSRPLPPAPPLEAGSEGALRARRLADQMYQDVRSRTSGKRADLRGLDPTTFNAEALEEVFDLVSEDSFSDPVHPPRRGRGALWVLSSVFVLLVAIAGWWGLTGYSLVTAEQADPVLVASVSRGIDREGRTRHDADQPPQRPSSTAYDESLDVEPGGATSAGGDVGPGTAGGRLPERALASAGGNSSGASAAEPGSPWATAPADAQGSSTVRATPPGRAQRGGSAAASGAGGAAGVVTVAGDAHSIRLVGPDGSEYGPGEPLPAGAYTFRARWTEAQPYQGAGTIQVAPGDVLSVRCLSHFLRCRP